MHNLIDNLTEFCQLLRHSGIPVGPGESLEALQALTCLDLSDRDAVYLGLRSVLIKREADYSLYDSAFRIFFDGEVPPRQDPPPAERPGQEEGEGGDKAGYSPMESILGTDLALLDRSDQAEAARTAWLIARRLALRLSRRRRRTRHAPRIDLRATVRSGIRRAGVVLELLRSRRRVKPANLVLLLDVSGSMEPYSRFLLQFVHALQSGLPRTQSFAFATQLSRVSNELGERAYERAVEQAHKQVTGWGGGTRIGACLSSFLSEWAPALLGRRTAVIILSDGLDTGEPELLARALERIANRAARVIWLNPLAGDPRYQPLARGMAAALPYLDRLAPGHNLRSLMDLANHLEGAH